MINFAVDILDLADRGDLAEGKLLALFYIECQKVAVTLARQLSIHSRSAKVDIAARHIKVAQNLLVKLQAIFNKSILADQRPQKSSLFAFQNTAQTSVRIDLVANKTDTRHLCVSALENFEHKINTVVATANNLGRNPCRKSTILCIGFRQRRGIALGLCRAKDQTWLQFDEAGQLVILQALVAFKADLVDRRELGDLDHKLAALRDNLNAFKKTRGQNPLIGFVNIASRDRLPASDSRICQDRSSFDPLVAFDSNRIETVVLRDRTTDAPHETH